MKLGAVPVKTEKGRLEMRDRTDALSAVQRRLLILADGKRSVNELGAFVRAGELDAAVTLSFARHFGAKLL